MKRVLCPRSGHSARRCLSTPASLQHPKCPKCQYGLKRRVAKATTSFRDFIEMHRGDLGGQAAQILPAFLRNSPRNPQVGQKSKLFFSNFRMSNDVQIWIDRHRVGISKNGAQLRQISDLFFPNRAPVIRLSNLIYRHTVAKTQFAAHER